MRVVRHPVEPAVSEGAAFERVWLDDTSWLDLCRGWLTRADVLYAALVDAVPWQQGRVWRYDRWVTEPRLGATWRVGDPPWHPVLPTVHRQLRDRYGLPFGGAAMVWYRDGRDSVGFHRDRELRWLDDTLIAVLTLGAQRAWWLRPRANRYDHESPQRGATHDVSPAGGDLLVMGGRCQADWEHAVPKVHRPIGGRVALQFRWTARRGRPERGPTYRAPRHYSS
ncbi:MAG: alpha-ketoglutarate-dependent dioxygenase AlkB [Acidimicrobiales bacterium]